MSAEDILDAPGLSITAAIPVVYGALNVTIDDAGTIQEYIRDPQAFAAKTLGVSKIDYLSWVACAGVPLCGGRTARGRECRGVIKHAGLPVDADPVGSPKAWLALHRNGFCSIHGGEG